MSEEFHVVRNHGSNRYETTVDGKLAIADYVLGDGTITFTHTAVPEEIQEQGVASALARTALNDAKAEGLLVVPQCAFFRGYIEKNPEYQALVKSR